MLTHSTFARFVVSGIITAVAYFLMSLGLEHALQNAVAASFVSYTIVIFIHFVLNNFYTFRQRGIEIRTVFKYASYIVLFAVLNLVVAAVVHALNFPTYVLYLSNALISPLFGFAVMKAYVFRRASDARP